MKYYGKCIAQGQYISLTTTAYDEEDAEQNLYEEYKIDEVVEISTSPFNRHDLFTKHNTYIKPSQQRKRIFT